jgi:hypothetical protein
MSRFDEGGLKPQDERFSTTWQLPPTELSAGDAGAPSITETFPGFAQ